MAEPRGWFRWWMAVIGLGVLGMIGQAVEGPRPQVPPSAPPSTPSAPTAADPCGPEPVHNGSQVAGVAPYIKEHAHDPSTLENVECTAPERTPRCWRTRCRYRAANALGAKVLEQHTFYLGLMPGSDHLHQVIEVE